jgi:starvation-inducible DNA-binding protein
MSKKIHVLHEEQQVKLIELLNRRLADAIDLQLQSRQACWNVKGPHFMALRELFDQVAQGVQEDANLMAARIVQLGGRAEGTAQAVARRTALTAFDRHARYASAQASALKDADTAALFTEIARGIDTWLWFVQTSRQAGS